MICPKCGSENKDGANYCKICGAPLRDVRSDQPDNRWRDTSCNDSGYTFIHREPSDYRPHSPQKDKFPWYILILLVVVIIGGGFFAYTYMHPASNQKGQTETVATTAAGSTESSTTATTESTAAATQGTSELTGGVAGDTESAQEEQADNIPFLGADTYNYSSYETPEDFGYVNIDDYSITYPKNFFKDAVKVDGGYELRTEDGQATLEVRKTKLSEESEETLNQIYDHYMDILDTGNKNNGVKIKPKTNSDSMHTVIGGYEQSDSDRGVYVIAATEGDHLYFEKFSYKDESHNDTVSPQNYVIDCIYKGCSFSGTSKEGLQTYQHFVDSGNSL